ncbi:MAG: hypothetical protein GY826_25250 [Fuerstiella sp.]|nr:hypothetical protein [Fuerstiella sp.]
MEDRIHPSNDGGLVRRFILRKQQASPRVEEQMYLRAHFGKALVFERVGRYSDKDGMTVSVSMKPGHAGELRNSDTGTEWIIPLKVKSETQIELRYSW